MNPNTNNSHNSTFREEFERLDPTPIPAARRNVPAAAAAAGGIPPLRRKVGEDGHILDFEGFEASSELSRKIMTLQAAVHFLMAAPDDQTDAKKTVLREFFESARGGATDVALELAQQTHAASQAVEANKPALTDVSDSEFVECPQFGTQTEAKNNHAVSHFMKNYSFSGDESNPSARLRDVLEQAYNLIHNNLTEKAARTLLRAVLKGRAAETLNTHRHDLPFYGLWKHLQVKYSSKDDIWLADEQLDRLSKTYPTCIFNLVTELTKWNKIIFAFCPPETKEELIM